MWCFLLSSFSCPDRSEHIDNAGWAQLIPVPRHPAPEAGADGVGHRKSFPASPAQASHNRRRASGSEPMPGVGSSFRPAHSLPVSPAVSGEVASQRGVSAAFSADFPKVFVIHRNGPPTSCNSPVFFTSPGWTALTTTPVPRSLAANSWVRRTRPSMVGGVERRKLYFPVAVCRSSKGIRTLPYLDAILMTRDGRAADASFLRSSSRSPVTR